VNSSAEAGRTRGARFDKLDIVAEALRRGEVVDDRLFDAMYPHEIRRASPTHWTPVEVAVRAAELLAVRPGARVLDIGAGVGKFCIIAAACADVRVRGIERRPHLVEAARRAASRTGVHATFTHGVLDPTDARDIDGVYLFNPFGENLAPEEDWIDKTVELSEARFRRDLAIANDFFRVARVGTRVVTYCGFGGRLPREYALITREHCAGRLELWVKTDAARTSKDDGARER
jgi:predicted RNA methylase